MLAFLELEIAVNRQVHYKYLTLISHQYSKILLSRLLHVIQKSSLTPSQFLHLCQSNYRRETKITFCSDRTLKQAIFKLKSTEDQFRKNVANLSFSDES